MLQIVYIILCVISIIKCINRKFDLYTIAVLSYIFYTLVCVIGETWITRSSGYYYYAKIDKVTYLCVYAQLFVINFFPYLIKTKRVRKENAHLLIQKDLGGKVAYEIIFVSSSLVFLYNFFFSIGIKDFFSLTSKSELMNSANTLFSYAIWGILISFTYGIQSKRKVIFLVSAFILFILLVMGSRSYLILAILILLLVKADLVKKTVSANWKKIVVLVILMFIFMIYKEIYKYIRAMDFEAVISALENYKTYLSVFTNGETRTTFSLYNFVISEEYRIPFKDSLARILSVLPFVNNALSTSLPIRFSEIAKNSIFGSTYGLGSSFWAESFSMGSYAFLILATCLWISIIKKYHYRITVTNRTAPFWTVFMVYISFYIHRLDWVQMWGALKSIIVWYIVYRIIKMALRRGYV